MPRRPVPLWYLVVAILLSSLGLGVAGIQYTNHVDQKSNRQWCQIVVTLDDTYQKEPPQSPTGIVIAREMHRMRTDFNCEGR